MVVMTDVLLVHLLAHLMADRRVGMSVVLMVELLAA